MKNLLKIIILIFLFINSSIAGNIDDNTWYLESMELDGVLYPVPDNDEVPFVPLMINDSLGFSDICDLGLVAQFDNFTSSLFHMVYLDYAGSDCLDSENNLFKNDYFSFFESGMNTDFTYNITEQNGINFKLIITNINGDVVTYKNSFYFQAPAELTANEWVLNTLIIEDTAIIPPSNNEVSDVLISFVDNGSTFGTNVCAFLAGTSHFNLDLHTFSVHDAYMTTNSCGMPQNSSFANYYFGDFYDYEDLPSPYSYEVTGSGANTILNITKENGDIAIYNNGLVSSPNLPIIDFKLYPNPVTDRLIILEESTYSIQLIEITDALGKTLMTTTSKDINMSNLSAGLYYVKVTFENGQSTIKKVFKK